MQTRARLDGDEFVLDGQKVWTSGAQHSDYAACLTRSDPARPKREGITMLIVDMHSPGITVRPLRQMTGEAHFNEVFLDGVRVPVANVLGDVHDGWRVARTMLAFERQALGGMGWRGWRQGRLRRAGGRGASGATCRTAPCCATGWCSCASARWCCGTSRATCRSRRSAGDGAAASLLKLAMAQLVQESALVAVDVAGMHATAWEPTDPEGDRWWPSC